MTMSTKPTNVRGIARYKGLIISTVLFLLVISILMAISAYLAEQVNRNRLRSFTVTSSMNPALSEISRDIYRLSLLNHQDPGVKARARLLLQNISDNNDKVEKTLQTISTGGEVIGASNTTETLHPFTDERLAQAVADTLPVWQQNRQELNILLQNANQSLNNNKKINVEVDKLQEMLQQTVTKVSVFDRGIRQSTRAILSLSQNIVFAGIIFVMVYFAIFAFYFLRKLRVSDRIIEKMTKETDQIMETMSEGMFLLDDDLTISSQYSRELEKIIGQRDLGGKHLNDVMKVLVPSEDVETTEEFIEQLFNDRVNERLITDLNPLNRIKIDVDDFSGYRATHYVDFAFSRVYQNDEITRVLVTANDVSSTVLLEERLSEEREQNDLQTEMIIAILNTDRKLLQSFVHGTQKGIDKINTILKNPGKEYSDLIEKINIIYREAHSIKGEASALKLHAFVNIATALEEKLKEIRAQREIGGNDFLPLTIMLEEKLSLLQAVRELMTRIGGGAEGASTQVGGVSGDNVLQKYFTNFAADVAKRNNKEIDFQYVDTTHIKLPEKIFDTIKDVSIQLLRNAIVHGIESTGNRTEKGKPARGRVKLNLSKTGNGVELIVEDDGGGINFDKLRQKMINDGVCSAENAKDMDKKQLIAIMFQSGMSTADGVNEDAGRGVGMDVIKDRVQELGGKIRVSSAEGQSTRFIIDIPM